jgi:predicted CoA-binding protein
MVVTDEAGLRDILTTARVIAVVGLSSDRSRPSHDVAAYLQEAGYTIIPVNPNETEVLGVPAVASLRELEGQAIDIVDVFRRPADVLPHAMEAIAIGAKCLWLQMGVHHDEAVRRAAAAGLKVVSNRCTMRDHARLVGRRQA